MQTDMLIMLIPFLVTMIPSVTGLFVERKGDDAFDERQLYLRALAGHDAFVAMIVVSAIFLACAIFGLGKHMTADFVAFWIILLGVSVYGADNIFRGSYFGIKRRAQKGFIITCLCMVITCVVIFILVNVTGHLAGEGWELTSPLAFRNTFYIGYAVLYGVIAFALFDKWRQDKDLDEGD